MADTKQLLYLANMRGADIYVYDVETLEHINTIEMLRIERETDAVVIGEQSGAHRVAGKRTWAYQPDSFWPSPDGRILYASRFLAPYEGARATREKGDLIAIDTATDEVLWSVEIIGHANHITATPDAKKVFVPVRDRDYLEVVDTDKQEIVDRIACGWGPHGTEISHDGQRVWAGTMWDDALNAVDVDTHDLVHSITLGEAIRPFVVTKDEKKAYVQLSKMHGFQVVDIEAGRATQTVHLPPLPAGVELPTRVSYTVNHGMAMSDDEQTLIVAASAADYLAAYKLPEMDLLAEIPVGREPAYVHLSPDEKLVFTPNRKENTLSFISTETWKELKRVPAGEYPNRMVAVNVPDRKI